MLIKYFFPVTVVIMLALPTPVFADDPAARKIIDQVVARHEVPFEFEEQEMTLIDKAGNKEVRELRRYARRGKDGKFRYLVVFRAPAGVRGVALLTWQGKGGNDDQWLYLPAMGKKMKRIAKGGFKNYFMGTDYTFEDLVSESRDKFTYTSAPDETLEGKEHYVIDVTPGDKKVAKKSAYKYRRVYVRKDIMFITRTDYFDKRGRLLKVQSIGDINSVEGDIWRAGIARMVNKKESHTTEVRISKRSLAEKAVPKSVFKKRFITSGKHVR